MGKEKEKKEEDFLKSLLDLITSYGEIELQDVTLSAEDFEITVKTGAPASAASVAGLFKFHKQNPEKLKGKKIVCILTGTGLKDPDLAVKESPSPISLPPNVEILEETLGLK